MNSDNRLYRITSDGMLAGVAAGLARYFNTDVNIIRLLMVLAAFFTGGAVVAVYLALWVILPTVTSTSKDVSGIMQENLNEIAARAGVQLNNQKGGGNPNSGGTVNLANGGQGQAPQAGTTSRHSVPNVGAIILITLGALLLLGNLGVFHFFRWHFFWPLLLVGLGIMLLRRKR